MRWKESGPSGEPFRFCIMGQALADAPFAVKASGYASKTFQSVTHDILSGLVDNVATHCHFVMVT